MEPNVFMNKETLFLTQEAQKSPTSKQNEAIITKLMWTADSSDHWACDQAHSSELVFSYFNYIFDLFRDVSPHLDFKSQAMQAPSATPALCFLHAPAQARLGTCQYEQRWHNYSQ